LILRAFARPGYIQNTWSWYSDIESDPFT
jgi:hypothetical protein